MMALEKEPYERLRALIKELGWPKTWLAGEIDKMIAGLLQVAEQAIQDAKDHKEMTEEEAKKRYEDLMRAILDTK